jgi:hypothetical protein
MNALIPRFTNLQKIGFEVLTAASMKIFVSGL